MALNKSRFTRSVLLLCASAMMAIGFLTTAYAQSSEEAVKFDLPAQSLEQALKSFSISADKQLMFATDLAEGKMVAGLSGEMEPMQALDVLLDGSGLVYETTSSNVILVKVADTDQGGASDSKNLTPTPVLMAQNQTTPPPTTSSENEENRAQQDRDVNAKIRIPEIVVYGDSTNADIRRTRDDVQPYVVLSSDVISRSTAPDLDSFLKSRLPMNAVQTSLSQESSSLLGNQSTVDLRGLGSDQTLILVNGRRISNVALGLDSRQPDINGIPLSSIDRIEVLPSTASGIYGGGATGGVVNIILKQDYRGLQLKGTYENTFATNAPTVRMEASGGAAFEDGRSRLSFVVSHSDADPLLVGDRDFSSKGRQLLFRNDPATFNAGAAPPIGSTANIRSTDGSDLVFDDGTFLGSSFASVPLGYAGTQTENGDALVANAGSYNLGVPNDLNGAQASIINNPTISTVSVNARREFTESVDVFLDILATRTEGNFQTAALSTSFTLQADAPNNPFNTDIQVSHPVPELRFRQSSLSESLNASTGVILKMLGNWSSALEFSHNSSSLESEFTTFGLNSEGFAAREDGTLDVLRDVNGFPVDYSPYMVGSPNIITGPNDATVQVVSIRAGGPMFKLGGNDVYLTMLLERREATSKRSFLDSTGIDGTTTIDYRPETTQDVDSAYVEVLLPMVTANETVSWAHLLDFQASIRWDDYRSTTWDSLFPPIVDSRQGPLPEVESVTSKLDSVDYTIGFRYAPVESLLVRASFGTGFVPPGLSELVSGDSFFFPAGVLFLPDPKRGGLPTPTGPLEFRPGGGNPSLKPEESESWSAGVVLSPVSLPGLRMSVDFTRIDKTDEIGMIGLFELLELEDQLPGRIGRAPLEPDAPEGYTAGPITLIDQSAVNIASTSVEAYDLQIDYEWESGVGNFHLYTVATWMRKFEQRTLPTSDPIERVGFTNGPLDWRGNIGLSWFSPSDRWTIDWNAQYYDSYTIYPPGSSDSVVESLVNAQGSANIPSQTYHDVTLRYRSGALQDNALLSDVTLTLGIQNIFDEDPPIIATTSATGGYSTYGDPRGSRYLITVAKEF